MISVMCKTWKDSWNPVIKMELPRNVMEFGKMWMNKSKVAVYQIKSDDCEY